MKKELSRGVLVVRGGTAEDKCVGKKENVLRYRRKSMDAVKHAKLCLKTQPLKKLEKVLAVEDGRPTLNVDEIERFYDWTMRKRILMDRFIKLLQSNMCFDAVWNIKNNKMTDVQLVKKMVNGAIDQYKLLKENERKHAKKMLKEIGLKYEVF